MTISLEMLNFRDAIETGSLFCLYVTQVTADDTQLDEEMKLSQAISPTWNEEALATSFLLCKFQPHF